MNTQRHVHRLEAGQALPIPRRSGGPAVLTEGELVVQEPARWLAGTVVQPAAVRVVAPALLPASAASFVAVRPSCVVVQELPSALDKLRAAATWIRAVLRKPGRHGAGRPVPN